MFTRSDLDALLKQDQAPALSFFVPTHRAGREIRQDPVRLRNLKARAVDRLMDAGMRRPDAEALLEPVQRLIEDEFFWRHQDRGLAVFVAPGVSHVFKVPVELEEKLAIGPSFHIRPLLPLLGADAPFLILAVSAHNARVFSGSRAGLTEVEGLEIPKSVVDIAAETDYDNTLDSPPPARHGARRGSPVNMVKTHNFGEDPEEQRKAQLIEFLHRVGTGFEEFRGDRHVPVVLMAQDEVRGNLKSIGRFHPDPLIEVDINPDALDEGELHRRAYEAVRPTLTKHVEKEIDHFYSLYNDGSSKSSDEVPGIVKAARYGQVDVLLVQNGETVWGRYDESKDEVAIHDQPERDDVDLLDCAAKDTLRNGGRVFLVDRDQLRAGSRNLQAGAILRFAQPK